MEGGFVIVETVSFASARDRTPLQKFLAGRRGVHGVGREIILGMPLSVNRWFGVQLENRCNGMAATFPARPHQESLI
jgi:hypothetical protein